MSQQVTIHSTIRDFKVLEVTCSKLDLTLKKNRETWSLSGKQNERATIAQDGDAYSLSYDKDVHYSPFARRFGADAGLFLQAYSETLVEESYVGAVGGFINSREVEADGTIVLRIAVGE